MTPGFLHILEEGYSMGVFLKHAVLVNRAPVSLSVRFDGQEKTLEPGENIVPEIVVEFAKNQNPVMGSQDPYNPHISGAQYLVGVKGTADNIEPLTDEEWQAHLEAPTRTNSRIAFEDRYGGDPKARLVVHGKGRKSTANSRVEAGGIQHGLADFGRD